MDYREVNRIRRSQEGLQQLLVSYISQIKKALSDAEVSFNDNNTHKAAYSIGTCKEVIKMLDSILQDESIEVKEEFRNVK